MRRNQPPALFFCRHDQFAACRARQMIPIDPKWLIEALGVAELDPSLPYQGPPTLVGPNRLEIRAVRETPTGPTTRITIIDAIRRKSSNKTSTMPKGACRPARSPRAIVAIP